MDGITSRELHLQVNGFEPSRAFERSPKKTSLVTDSEALVCVFDLIKEFFGNGVGKHPPLPESPLSNIRKLVLAKKKKKKIIK